MEERWGELSAGFLGRGGVAGEEPVEEAGVASTNPRPPRSRRPGRRGGEAGWPRRAAHTAVDGGADGRPRLRCPAPTVLPQLPLPEERQHARRFPR